MLIWFNKQLANSGANGNHPVLHLNTLTTTTLSPSTTTTTTITSKIKAA